MARIIGGYGRGRGHSLFFPARGARRARARTRHGMPSYHVVGMTTADMVFALGRMQSIRQSTRVRGVHTGAIAAVLWACKVDPDVVKAAAALGLSVAGFLHTVLPDDAHVLCRQAKVGIALQRQSLFWLSPEVQMQSAWSSRAELIEVADRAVWLPGWLSFVPAPGSAAVGARSAAAGIVLVGPRTITHAATTRTIRASNQQFASWYSAGTEMPLG